MFDMDRIQRAAAAVICAVILTTASVSAAVGPARVAETSPVVTASLDLSGEARG